VQQNATAARVPLLVPFRGDVHVSLAVGSSWFHPVWILACNAKVDTRPFQADEQVLTLKEVEDADVSN